MSDRQGPFRRLRRSLGPGLITGAADDDPSGIATYSQAGAQFGFALAWTMLLTFPFMAAIQVISACIGWQKSSFKGPSPNPRNQTKQMRRKSSPPTVQRFVF